MSDKKLPDARKSKIASILVILIILTFSFTILGVRPAIIADTLSSHSALSLKFSPDGKYIASGGDSCDIRLWDLRTGECIRTPKAYKSRVSPIIYSPPESSIAYTPDGRLIISGGEDGLVRIWSAGTLKLIKVLEGRWERFDYSIGQLSPIYSISVSNDGVYCASGSLGGKIRVWEIATGRCVRDLKAGCSVFSVCFSPDTRYIASSESKSWRKTGGITLWDWRNGVEASTFLRSEDPDTFTDDSALFTPDGKYLVRWTRWSDYILLIDARTGGIVKHWGKSDDAGFTAACISPKSDLVAYSGESRAIQVYRIPSAQKVCEFGEPTLEADSLCFSPDGNLLASGDKTGIRIWEIPSGRLLLSLAAFENNEWACWTPDAHYNCSTGAEQHLSVNILSIREPASSLRAILYDPRIASKRLRIR